MGFFGIRTSKRGKHGPNLAAKERDLKQKVKYIEGLRRSPDPADQERYREIMDQRVGLFRKKGDRITETIETIDALRNAGLIQDPAGVGAGFNWKDVLQGLGELGKQAPAIVDAVRGGGQQEVAYEQPAADATRQIEAPRKMVQMTLISRILIGKVKNPLTQKIKAPPEVADMLLEHYDDTNLPMVRELVDGFCQTPDENMGEFIQGFAAKYPDLHGFLAWMDSDERRQWFGQCILAVRARMSNGAQQSADGGI